MEPTIEEFSAEIEKLRKMQYELRDSIHDLQEKKLFPVERQIAELQSFVKMITKFAPVTVIVASIVLTLLGYLSFSHWKKGVADDIKEHAWSELQIKMYPELDKSILLTGDLEAMLRKAKEDPENELPELLNYLERIAHDQPRREYVFRLYMDLLINKGDYIKAYSILQKVKEHPDIFPDGFFFSKTFVASGFATWVKSFYDHKNCKDLQAQKTMEDARYCLEKAEERARNNSFRRMASLDQRDVILYYFFFNLSEDKRPAAEDSLTKFLQQGGRLDWKKITQYKWFGKLVAQRPHVQTLLQDICKNTFPDGITTKGNI